jgi:hypothetical protein
MEKIPPTSDVAALDYDKTPDAPALWDRIVAESAEGWFWHTRANFDFNFCAARDFAARDLSFFLMRGDRAIGVAPLTVQKRRVGDFEGQEAAYYSGFLPWPCFAKDLPDLPGVEEFAFVELERRARVAGVGRIRVRSCPASPIPEEAERIARIAIGRRYVHAGALSHVVALNPDVLDNVRERYRRYHRKFSPQFELEVITGSQLDARWEQLYFELHVKDAGGQFRSRESYSRQADLARKGEGFYVAARHRERGIIAGMLLVSVFKDAAFDNSVGVDPEFQEMYVSHLLKWRAIEELMTRGVKTYELGERTELATLLKIPTPKQRGISHFKDGWARGNVKTVHELDKFLKEDYLAAHFASGRKALADYFEPPSAPGPANGA